jgi:7-carboxy-7-deazaguanine synthase
MRGTNPIRKPETGDGTSLQVQSVFSTLQGEGIYAGFPAIFIRLGGCNLACDFCDTEFESFTTESTDSLIKRVELLAHNENGKRIRNLIVITGGEPLRQPIEYLCKNLIEQGFKVQIETNGTLYRSLPNEVDIVCSPKNAGHGYHAIRPDLLARVNALKFIVSAHHTLYQSVAEVGQSLHNTPVYVQPMDEYDAEKNRANVTLAKKLALEYGYRLSLQTHKIIGVE